jgi:SH3-like domain-containing protein
MKYTSLVLVALLHIVVQFTVAQRGSITVTQATKALKHPGATDSVAASLSAGTTLQICEVDGDWLKSLTPSKKAIWIHKDVTDVLAADRGIFEMNTAIYGEPGRYNAQLRPDMTPTGEVRKGTSVQVDDAKGGWYHITFADGTNGWVHQMYVTRSLLAPAKIRMDIYPSRDTANIVRTMTNVKLLEYSPCIILGHGTNYTHIRSSNGQEGWVFAAHADYDDSTPAGHNIGWVYHLMRGIDHWGSAGWKWLGIFVLWWFLLPFGFSFLCAFLGFYGFGRIKFLPNLVVKTSIYLSVFAGLTILHNVVGEVYPYSASTLGSLWSILFMFVPPASLSGQIDHLRCRRCKTVADHPVVDMQYAGTEVRGTVSSSGTVNVTATDKHVITKKCVACGYRWQLSA